MTLSQLQRIRSAALGSDGPQGLPQPRKTDPEGPGFGKTLQDAIAGADEAQKAADAQVTAFVAGEQENVHEVMIAMNEAKLSFQLMTEVRNRLLETYQELMRMQV